ncbi:MAG: AMIN domain-containing protein, partial [Proteobacteria bacterium]|nr:AMIN domain-containing protein [Pseudomonadota bacterium]
MRRPKELLQNVVAAAWLGLSLLGSAPAQAAEALDAHLTLTGRSTIFELTMSEGVTAEVFTLANPYRVVIDLPDLSFRLDPAAGKKGAGLVSAFRYGQFAEHKSRVVIDTKAHVNINSANMTRL